MNDVAASVHPAVPGDARALIWDEFFQSRGRGISLAVHSPWIDSEAGLFCITARRRGTGALAGTLVVKLHAPSPGPAVGLIGYVCVAHELRGRGISRLLIERSIAAAQDRGLSALALWTQTAQVYRGSGFTPQDGDILQQYGALRSGETARAVETAPWPHAGDCARGLPAFARAARRVSSARASAILLETLAGPSVAEWTGADEDVADLIAATVQGEWWLNALAGDTLPAELARRAALMQERPPTMMVRPLDGADSVPVVRVRLLDRA